MEGLLFWVSVFVEIICICFMFVSDLYDGFSSLGKILFLVFSFIGIICIYGLMSD